MQQAWQPLLANVAVIAVFVSFWTSFQSWLHKVAPDKVNLVFGMLCGMTGMAIMTMPFEIVPGILFDLRSVVIILAGFFSGPVGGLIAGSLTGTYRVWIGGVGTLPGLAGIAVSMAIGIFLNMQRRDSPATFRDILDVAFAAASASIVTIIALPATLHEAIFQQAAMPLVILNFISVVLAGTAIVHENRRRDVARANEIYGAVIDALPDCLNAKDAEGRFLVANPATARLMGANDKSELIGKTDADFYDARTAADFRQEEHRVIRWGQAETLEQKFVQRDGKVAWLSTLKVPFPSHDGRDIGIITHNRDITEQKQLELNLTETQARLSDALAHMADALAMFDRDGRLVYCNDRYRRMFDDGNDVHVSGMTLRTILERAAENGNVVLPDGQEAQAWIEDQLAKAARCETSVMAMADGRFIEKRHAMVREGAWLTVFSDITERRWAERELRELNSKLEVLARTDGLTGLTNRKTFDDRLYAEFARSQRHGNTLGLMLIDVDRFKAFNDIYGHPAGDACLILVAGQLKRAARRPPDVVARYGGEEFVAIFPETDEAGMWTIAEQFRQSVRDLQHAHVGSEKGVVTVSIGIAVMDSGSDLRGPADLLRAADEALYRAKGAGRDCIRIADIPVQAADDDMAAQRAS